MRKGNLRPRHVGRAAGAFSPPTHTGGCAMQPPVQEGPARPLRAAAQAYM